MKEIYSVAQQYKLHLHLDGARIFNSAHHLGVEVHEITQFCDSVMVCISKGLCAPVGSVLAGSAEFIRKAKRIRKMIGGTMRQVGVLASCGLVALEKMIEPLKEDNEMAIKLASGLK